MFVITVYKNQLKSWLLLKISSTLAQSGSVIFVIGTVNKTCPLNKEYLWLKSLVTEIKCSISNLVFVSSYSLYQNIFLYQIFSLLLFLLVQSLHLFNHWASSVPKVGQQLWKKHDFNSNVSISVHLPKVFFLVGLD